MRYFFHIAVVLILGLAVGGISAKWALEAEDGFGSVRYGSWTSWPLAGSVDADPYTKARVAKDGAFPQCAADGLTFFLALDENNQPLRRECQYSLVGSVPPARIWTLSIKDLYKRPVLDNDGGTNSVFSLSVLRELDGSFVIDIGRQPVPMNWLPITGIGPMRLVLRLYDTPITTSAGLAEPIMPKLVSKDCLR